MDDQNKDMTNELKKSRQAANRTFATQLVQVTQQARTNGILQNQLEIQNNSLKINFANLEVNKQILSELSGLTEVMEVTAGRAKKEDFADKLNAYLLKAERLIEKYQNNEDLYSLIMAAYEINEKFISTGITFPICQDR